MLDFQSQQPVRLCDGLTRRDFLKVGTVSAGAVALSLADLDRLALASPGMPGVVTPHSTPCH